MRASVKLDAATEKIHLFDNRCPISNVLHFGPAKFSSLHFTRKRTVNEIIFAWSLSIVFHHRRQYLSSLKEQVRLVSAKAERPNPPSRGGGGGSKPGGLPRQ